jgi:DNA-binding SARP family transcriptional activator
MLERKGERGEAARVYLECVRLLKNELGVAPSEETQAVYREVAG